MDIAPALSMLTDFAAQGFLPACGRAFPEGAPSATAILNPQGATHSEPRTKN